MMLISLCLFLCGVFFFFKQKTAYEMRISDWSSDVCSSDLNLTPRRAIAGFSFCTRSRHPCAMPVPAATATPSDPAHAPLTGLPGVGPRVAEKLAARGMSTLQDLWLQLPRQYEIGRASCRESVCQYV